MAETEKLKTSNAFLGKGWSFPPAFSKKELGVKMLEAEDDIESSLEILLSTRLGERIMQPKYGCDLNELAFEQLTTTMTTYIRDLISTAILYFEPRIEADNIELGDKSREGMVIIHISYRVRATNSRKNMVYPYYLNEAGIKK